ncbi:RnfABCDGE type electron transport complex subunit G [Cloacibacillus evryensis]|uniref:Ion-translocating oxidoreductase complex subunit G n=1 Tax=Cloacibacillus evryensis TaxID=508460 RepID=A0AAW5K120_9BACT|nr:RnfABCDGE type electron transport complex subunit G [Cloacibacillus evryensis]EHL71472.1 electron transport complex, rnfabcdge type, G subunit [Synergistes sp. 3_1_syn1]MCQ4764410.1 RnfABCDGE type electron transport complex subunit G [Cloacibacillus evryensis]MCQ4813647.1 RnfABCDGE type electron transport complex subunit G [Cloacibacillus evryensis]MEA5033917.1 RnfABCDGE type electron transport complex subunit G [Cloacibacillus evryensis]
MGKIVKLGLVLFVITAVTGLILGAVHTVTLEPIRRSQEKAKNEALSATLPGAKDFKAIEIKGDAGIIKEIFEGSDGGSVVGYNFTVTPKGYGGPIEFVVGISNDGLVKDIKILTSSETPGLGAKAADEPFAGQFRDRKAQELAVTKTPPENDAQIQAISGATISSSAVVTGVNAAVSYWKNNLGGGDK